MKNCLAAIVLFAVVAVVSAMETTVKKYVPDSAVAAAQIKVGKFLRNPVVSEVLNQPEFMARRQKYEEKSGVRLTDLKTVWFFIDGLGRSISLCALNRTVDLENVFKSAEIPFSKSTVGGRTVFHLTGNGQGEKAGEVAELEPGLLVSGEKGAVVRYLKGKRGNTDVLADVFKKIPAGKPVKVAFVNTIKNADGTVADPVHVYGSFDFTGKEQKDFDFQFNFFCGSTDGAQMFGARLPMFIMMGSALLFAQAPELSEQLVSCVKNRVEESVVMLNAVVPEALGRQTAAYIEQNTERFIPRKKSVRKSGKRRKKSVVAE